MCGIQPEMRCRFCGAVFAMVLGAIVFALALGLFFGVPVFVDSQIKATTVVSGPDSTSYDTWVDLCDETVDMPLPPVYMNYTFYNFTNYYDFILNGSVPNVEAIGPYVYRECKKKVDIEFSDTGEEVTYSVNYTYYWQEDMNPGLSEDDLIVTVNPVVLSLISLFGSEHTLAAALLNPYVNAMGDFFTNVFPFVNVNTYSIEKIQNNRTQIVADSLMTDGAFQTQWANGTEADISGKPTESLWSQMYLALYNKDKPSDITADAASRLWDVTDPLSFVNPKYQTQLLWLDADKTGDSEQIRTALGLTSEQLSLILQWRADVHFTAFAETQAYLNDLNSRANQVQAVEDLGALQWATGLSFYGQTKPNSVFNLLGMDLGYSEEKLHFDDLIELFKTSAYLIPALFPPEVYYYETEVENDDDLDFTVKSYNTLFNPNAEGSITSDPQQYAFLVYCMAQKNSFVCNTGLRVTFGLSGSQRKTLSSYFWQYLYPSEALYVLQPGSGLGLFDSRSVHYRLWFGPLGIGGGNGTVQDVNSTYYTGAGDTYDHLAEIIAYEGMDVLPGREEVGYWDGYWPQPVPVFGAGDGTQFPPGTLQEGGEAYAWVSEILRTVRLSYNKTMNIKGLDSYVYLADLDQLGVDPLFDQYIEGYGNMTHLSVVSTAPAIDAYNAILAKVGGVLDASGTSIPESLMPHPMRSNATVLLPVFLSFRDMFGCDPRVANTTTGQEPNFYDDVIYLAVEPETGATVAARKALQYNLYLSKEAYDDVFDMFYSGILDYTEMGIMWPICVIDENGVITQDLADELVFALYTTEDVAKYSFFIGVPVSVVIFIAGFALMVSVCIAKKAKYDDYEVIN
mmetsp:Transcript_24776/g.69400  ORF Transcript_24776/g.69400 Transcript_24776/m.69400 type:complete len:851 (-) Transcript_24776:103-2655(-)